MKKEEVFIDLSKCSEEERKRVEKITGIIIYRDHFYIHFHSVEKKWLAFTCFKNQERKKEIQYPDFIKVFEGGEGENNGWIKIGEDGKIYYDGEIWGVDKAGYVHYFSIDDFIEIGYLTHYQPLQKPEPPKF